MCSIFLKLSYQPCDSKDVENTSPLTLSAVLLLMGQCCRKILCLYFLIVLWSQISIILPSKFSAKRLNLERGLLPLPTDSPSSAAGAAGKPLAFHTEFRERVSFDKDPSS